MVEDEPYKIHPNSIVGRNCSKGICTIEVKPETDMTATFEKIGIECITNRKISESLARCNQNQIDPFKQGFDHMADKKYLKELDMNSLRICFQVFLPCQGGYTDTGAKIVSNVVRDKRVHERLKIIDMSDESASTKGDKKIIMFTTKVNKDDVEVHFEFNYSKSNYYTYL